MQAHIDSEGHRNTTKHGMLVALETAIKIIHSKVNAIEQDTYLLASKYMVL